MPLTRPAARVEPDRAAGPREAKRGQHQLRNEQTYEVVAAMAGTLALRSRAQHRQPAHTDRDRRPFPSATAQAEPPHGPNNAVTTMLAAIAAVTGTTAASATR